MLNSTPLLTGASSLMEALIDGDILVYRVGYASMDVDCPIALHRCKDLLGDIVRETDAEYFRVFLSDGSGGNFRYQIYPQYHANRKQEKPVWYNELRDFLITEFSAHVAVGQEADDAIGIAQREEGTVICSIDKDLRQIPGLHYNFVKKEWFTVTPEEGERFFYMQLLMGDTVDNIQGIPKVGPTKAAKILAEATPESYYETVREAYQRGYVSFGLSEAEIDDILLRYAQVLYIRRKEGEIWTPPKGTHLQKQLTDAQSLSTTTTAEACIRYTEPTGPETIMNGSSRRGLPKDESSQMSSTT